MTLFNLSEPLLRRKQTALDVQDLCGLLKINLKIGKNKVFSALYTRIDQALLLWSAIALLIFACGQFLPLSWIIQAYLSSVLTLVATGTMVLLTRFWTRVEQLSWVMYFWSGLMLLTLSLTNLGIFEGWGLILLNLCPLWLGSCSLGYLVTGLGLRSRLFIVTGLLHLLGIAVLPLITGWEFLFTGFLIAGSLALLSGVQWDMREPINSPILSEVEQEFNRKQRELRTSDQ